MRTALAAPLLLAVLGCHRPAQLAAPVAPPPPPEPRGPADVARELAPGESPGGGKAAVRIEIHVPTQRVALRLEGGAEVWVARPPMKDGYEVEVLAGHHYAVHQVRPDGQMDDEGFDAKPGVVARVHLVDHTGLEAPEIPRDMENRDLYRRWAAESDPGQQVRAAATLRELRKATLVYRAEGNVALTDLHWNAEAGRLVERWSGEADIPGTAYRAPVEHTVELEPGSGPRPHRLSPPNELWAAPSPEHPGQDFAFRIAGFRPYGRDAGPNPPTGWDAFAALSGPGKVTVEKRYDRLGQAAILLEGPLEITQLDWSGPGYAAAAKRRDGCASARMALSPRFFSNDPDDLLPDELLCVVPGWPDAGAVSVHVRGFRR